MNTWQGDSMDIVVTIVHTNSYVQEMKGVKKDGSGQKEEKKVTRMNRKS